MNKRDILGVALTMMLAAGAARAQDAAPPGTPTNSKQPIEINADQTLEWHRNDQQYIARGNVVAKQGDATVYGDLMVADYRPDPDHPNGNGTIYRLTATGHVILTSPGNKAVGDKVVYDVDHTLATLTGSALKLTTPDETITSRDDMQYNTDSGKAIAHGNAHVVHPVQGGNDVIDADTVTAWFEPKPPDMPGKPAAAPAPAATASPQQGRQLSHMAADGHVVITTPSEILHGDNGTYDAHTQIAVVTGKLVRIDRGPNVLTGHKAITNMATNISQMIADPGSGTQVHALFYPKSDKNSSDSIGKATAPAMQPWLTAITPPPSVPHSDSAAASSPPLMPMASTAPTPTNTDAPPVPPAVIGAP